MANRHSLHTPSGHRPTLAPSPQAFSLAAIRISSHTLPLLCGNSASYQRRLCASIRQLSASMRQLSASIRRGPETDPARYTARFGRSETAPAEKRQIEHFKIPKKGTFRPKTAPKKFGNGLPTRPQTKVAAGESLRQEGLFRAFRAGKRNASRLFCLEGNTKLTAGQSNQLRLHRPPGVDGRDIGLRLAARHPPGGDNNYPCP
jgi:hypothetical protein